VEAERRIVVVASTSSYGSDSVVERIDDNGGLPWTPNLVVVVVVVIVDFGGVNDDDDDDNGTLELLKENVCGNNVDLNAWVH